MNSASLLENNNFKALVVAILILYSPSAMAFSCFSSCFARTQLVKFSSKFTTTSRFLTDSDSFIPRRFVLNVRLRLHSSSCSSVSTEAFVTPSDQDVPKTRGLETTKLSELSLLEIRVGKIVEVAKHPEADSLYVERIDVGELSGPRTVVSGLVEFCKVEDLLHRNVIILCNLKPRALKGIMSNGMVLCASNTDHSYVTPLIPPSDSPPGQLISFAGYSSAFIEPGNKATKAFSKVVNDLFVNEEGFATYKNVPFMTPQGAVVSSLKGKIS